MISTRFVLISQANYIYDQKRKILISVCYYDFMFVFHAAGFKFKFYLESFK